MEQTSKHGILGRHQTCSKERIKVLSNKIERNHFTTHSQLIVSRKLCWWNLEKSWRRKYVRHLDFLQRFLLKIIGWENRIQKLLDCSEDSQQIKPKSKTRLSRTVRLVSEQPSGLLTQEIGKDVLFGCESTNSINTLLRWWGNDWNCFSHNYRWSKDEWRKSSFCLTGWASVI